MKKYGAASIPLNAGVSCAAPTLPFGTKITVEGLGDYVVQDRPAQWSVFEKIKSGQYARGAAVSAKTIRPLEKQFANSEKQARQDAQKRALPGFWAGGGIRVFHPGQTGPVGPVGAVPQSRNPSGQGWGTEGSATGHQGALCVLRGYFFSGGLPVRDGGRPFSSSGPSYSVRSIWVRCRPVSGTSL